jgi:hypothetical protein
VENLYNLKKVYLRKIFKIMKRLILIVFAIMIVISCKSQYSMLSTLAQNSYQYQGYLTDGPLNKAEASRVKLQQGIAWYFLYERGQLEGRSTIMDSAMTAFNTLYGKTHTPPSSSLTSVSYLDLDSLFIGGVKIENFYSKDSIQSWIDVAGVDSTVVLNLITANSINLDSLDAHLQIFRDSLDVTADVKDSVLIWIGDSVLNSTEIIALVVANSINRDSLDTHLSAFRDTLSFVTVPQMEDSIASALVGFEAGVSDSTWQSTIQDTLYLSSGGVTNYAITGTGSAGIRFIGIPRLTANNIRFDGGEIKGELYGINLKITTAPTSTSANIIPNNYDDPNTGYSWVSSDKLGLVAGGVSVFTSEYNISASKSITRVPDSLVVTGHINTDKLTVDSIQDGGLIWHKNLIGYGDVPTETSLRSVSSSGTLSWLAISDITDLGIENADSVAADDSNYVLKYNEDLTYYEKILAVPDTLITASLTDGTPTDTEIDNATGTTPSAVGANWDATIKDSDGTKLMYFIKSDGTTDWYYLVMTKAVNP